jgi:RNA polymerase sigma-70 factor (ECF subfamily)
MGMASTRDPDAAAEEFERLLEPMLGIAYGTAFRLTRSRDEAEDLVQEAAVQAFHAFATFQPGTNFKAWFFRILINRFRRNCRNRAREPHLVAIEDAPDLYLYAESARAGLAGQDRNPADLVLQKMDQEQIQAALWALPDEYRLVCVFYFMENLSYQEIADLLGCPVGTIRSRLHRGRKLLQKALWQIAQEHGVVVGLAGAEVGQRG